MKKPRDDTRVTQQSTVLNNYKSNWESLAYSRCRVTLIDVVTILELHLWSIHAGRKVPYYAPYKPPFHITPTTGDKYHHRDPILAIISPYRTFCHDSFPVFTVSEFTMANKHESHSIAHANTRASTCTTSATVSNVKIP